MEVWIYCQRNFSPMLHYTWRATRTMGKATHFYTFRFFLPTFVFRWLFLLWCWDHSSFHPHQYTPVSLHHLFCLHSAAVTCLHLDCKPQREARPDTSPTPYRGWVETLVCVFISQCYLIAIHVDKLPLIPDFSRNLNYPFLSPTVKLPDDPFLSKDKRKTNTEKVTKDQQHSPLVFCLLLCFLLDL